MDSLRDLISAAMLVAAAVLGALWLPATWLSENVVDQDGFLEIAAPLSQDAEVQRSLGDSAVTAVLDDDRIPDWIADQVEPLLQEQAVKLTDMDSYATMWDAVMSDLHTGLFTPGTQELEVDLGPAIDQLLTGVEETLPGGIEVPRPEGVSVSLATIPDVPLLNLAADAAPWAPWLGPAALVLVAAALLLGAHRRGLLILAGALALLAGGATLLVSSQIETLVPNALDQAEFVGPIVQAFQAQFAAQLLPQGVILLGGGALVMALGLVLLGLRRPRRQRRP